MNIHNKETFNTPSQALQLSLAHSTFLCLFIRNLRSSNAFLGTIRYGLLGIHYKEEFLISDP